MSSRAERRRHQRGDSGPPKRRDPMIAVYIGLAVVVALILIGFGVMSAIQNSQRNAQSAFVSSTPTPGPKSTAKAVQLKDGAAVGKVYFPKPDPTHGFIGDTPIGGRGTPVDGIPCQSMEGAVLHVHTHLALFYHGVQMQVPPYL